MTVWLRYLTPPLLALALYWPALGLPFFWDDVANFNFMAQRSLGELWTSAAGFPYYRPLGFTVWRVWHWLFGSTNTWAHHALNLLALTANGWLVGALAVRLARDGDENEADLYGWLAGALLTAFPFAALAVPLVASLFHLHVAFMALAAGVALLEYQRDGRWWWGVVSLAFAGLAPFVHESGVATGGILAVLWLFGAGRRTSPALSKSKEWRHLLPQRGLWVVLGALALNALFVPLWMAVPKMRTGGNLPGGLNPTEIWLNVVFFAVSLTFPVQSLALFAQQDWGWVDVTAVLTFGGAALFGVAVLTWRAGRIRWLLAGGAYAAVASITAIFTLPFEYVIVSPRLMVYGAPGVALLWGGAVVALVRVLRTIGRGYPIRGTGKPRRTAEIKKIKNPRLSAFIRVPNPDVGRYGSLVLAAGITSIMLIIPARHIVREVQLHVRALAPVWAMVQAVETYPDERHLVVNPTTWLARSEATYPIAHEGVVVIPEYVNPAQLAAIHTGGMPVVDGVAFPPIYSEPEAHYYDVWGPVMDWETMAARVREYDRVWLVTYGDGPLGFFEVGQALPQAAARQDVVASFGEGRVVLEAATAWVEDATVKVSLDWRMVEPSDEEVFAHAFDCAGNVLGLADGPPVGRMFPFWLWMPGDAIRDLRTIPLDVTAPDNCYQVEVGLFNPANGARPAAVDMNGERLQNDAVYLGVMDAAE